MSDCDFEKSIRELEATGRFRVLRRAVLGPAAGLAAAGSNRIAIIVDIETTGLDVQRDEIIEIGMIAFSYDAAGNFGEVIETFGGMQQPSKPIPAPITKLTGISNDEVRGQVIDKRAVETFLSPASLIIAHNAAFDRPICERLSTMFAEKPWACSATEIDWQRSGFEGTKLVYILNQFGMYHVGHRALDDCIALLNILRMNLIGAGKSVLAELLSCARKTRYRISVISPYELRSVLKSRGYRWYPGSSGRPRSWWIEKEEKDQSAELAFLNGQANLSGGSIIVEKVTALNRFKWDSIAKTTSE
ncbi:3'-5' exonuclease [Bradyrhizobium roseum]|uniref:3'-5' exonuclease n=1 Tax=Bradyrhizobium roseum TaxID=3056648 RepID=UPI002613333D|nr:3'-5' exonuclease [Bradyrhizobium roseus]WKA28363.1 3'-5' exonuclease [Bradyrhizobium roseus]